MKAELILTASSLLLALAPNLVAQALPGDPGPSAGHLAFYHPLTLAPADAGGAGGVEPGANAGETRKRWPRPPRTRSPT